MGQLSRLIFGVITALAVAAPVSASAPCELTVAPVEPGAAFHRVSGSDFPHNDEVGLQLYFGNEPVFLAPLLKATDDDGSFFDGLTMLPKDPVGTYTMRAQGEFCTAETTFVWALPDTAVELPTTSGQVPSIPSLTWALVAGALAFVIFLVVPLKAGARARTPLPATAVELPTPAAPSGPDLKWVVVATVLALAYVLLSPRRAGARGSK